MLHPERIVPLEDSPDFDVLSLVEADVWAGDTYDARAFRLYVLALEMRAEGFGATNETPEVL